MNGMLGPSLCRGGILVCVRSRYKASSRAGNVSLCSVGHPAGSKRMMVLFMFTSPVQPRRHCLSRHSLAEHQELLTVSVKRQLMEDTKVSVDSSVPELEKSKVDGENECYKGESDEHSASSEGDDTHHRHGSDDEHKQRRGRRRPRGNKGGKRHRKHGPYNNGTTFAERASMKREDLLASGHPLAPFNTTQYLIDDRYKRFSKSSDGGENKDQMQEDDWENPYQCDRLNESGDSSSSDCSPEKGLNPEFKIDYDRVYYDQMDMKSKDELIQMNSDLQRTVLELRSQIAVSNRSNTKDDAPPDDLK